MKLIISSLTALLFSGALLSAQMPGMVTMQQSSASQGTTLGANTTSGAAGIALGNRVVMRGYVDFIYGHTDFSESLENDTRFSTSADVDFLFDFSPVTAEIHLAATTDDIGLEQAFGRYAFNRDFNISFGRQVTSLGYEGDEATDLSSVTSAYFTDITLSSTSNQNFLQQNLTTLLNSAGITSGTVNGQMYSTAGTFSKAFVDALPKLRKNYVDGIKANFNNGKFGLSLGVHDGYWGSDDFNDNIAVDIAASLMIIPGLEAMLGYAHQDSDTGLDVGHFNGWLAYNPGDLTLAFEFDTFDIQNDAQIWDIMLMANYQFSNLFAMTLRYSHENVEDILKSAGVSGLEYDSDRITLALLFSITQNFGINVEYSHTEFSDDSADEFYVEGL
jgi:hypothetical protein